MDSFPDVHLAYLAWTCNGKVEFLWRADDVAGDFDLAFPHLLKEHCLLAVQLCRDCSKLEFCADILLDAQKLALALEHRQKIAEI